MRDHIFADAAAGMRPVAWVTAVLLSHLWGIFEVEKEQQAV